MSRSTFSITVALRTARLVGFMNDLMDRSGASRRLLDVSGSRPWTSVEEAFGASSPPPSLYDKALIIQGFVVSGVWQNLPAHTSAHTLDEVLLFDQRPIFWKLNWATGMNFVFKRRRPCPVVTNLCSLQRSKPNIQYYRLGPAPSRTWD
jgi:hypothetical protein